MSNGFWVEDDEGKILQLVLILAMVAAVCVAVSEFGTCKCPEPRLEEGSR